jgi:hypothetical protein
MKSKATDPWAALRAQLVIRGNLPPGEGWQTMKQIIESFGGGKGRTRRAIDAEVAAGRMEVFRGSEVSRSGCPAPQIWYRPKVKNNRLKPVSAPPTQSVSRRS